MLHSVFAIAAADSDNWSGLLIKGGLFFFFIVLPIVRSILEARRKQREAESKGTRPVEAEEIDENAAKQRWEELLRGETSSEAPPVPVVVARPARAQPARASQAELTVQDEDTEQAEEAERAEPDEETEADFSKTLTSLPNASMESTPTAAQPRTFAEERVDRRAAETLRREKFDRPNVETSAREALAPSSMVAFDEVERDLARARTQRRGDLLGLGTNRRAALQRALVGAEVLGRPVALRTGSEELGPLALRR